MVETFKDFLSALKALRAKVVADKKEYVQKVSHRQEAEGLGTTWFSELGPLARDAIADEAVVDAYDGHFNKLLMLGASPKVKSNTYTDVLDAVVKNFNKDLILPIQKLPKPKAISTPLDDMLSGIADPGESEYLREARDCARNEYFRAAAVLGWCAAIDRIHRKIQDVGFAEFNETSEKMHAQKKGRFKNFTKKQSVESLSELRKVVPDDVVLWIIEGMGLVEGNERDRLSGCFMIRNQSAHPGDAPLTQWNLLHFFSDLKEIVFENPKFAVSVLASEATEM